jgi:ABC-2 type transport system permease protein
MEISVSDLRAIRAISYREVIRFLRAKSRIVSSIAVPLIWFCAFGLGLGSAFDVRYGSLGYAEFLAPGIVAMTVLFASTLSGISIIVDKEFGVIKELLIAPVSRVSLVIGKLIGGMLTSFLRAILITILFCLILELHVGIWDFLGVLLVIALIAIGFGGFAIAIATKMESLEGYGFIVELIVMPIFFLSGAFFPIERLPSWLLTVVVFNPLTYGVDGLRLFMVGTSSFSLPSILTVLFVFDIAVVLLAAYLFERSGV